MKNQPNWKGILGYPDGSARKDSYIHTYHNQNTWIKSFLKMRSLWLLHVCQTREVGRSWGREASKRRERKFRLGEWWAVGLWMYFKDKVNLFRWQINLGIKDIYESRLTPTCLAWETGLEWGKNRFKEWLVGQGRGGKCLFLALWRLREEEWKFWDSLSYIPRFCLKNEPNNNKPTALLLLLCFSSPPDCVLMKALKLARCTNSRPTGTLGDNEWFVTTRG